MTKVLGRGLSVFISWHSAEGGQSQEGEETALLAYRPQPPATSCVLRVSPLPDDTGDTSVTETALALPPQGSRSSVCMEGAQTTRPR